VVDVTKVAFTERTFGEPLWALKGEVAADQILHALKSDYTPLLPVLFTLSGLPPTRVAGRKD
jgi:hypothetical protein